MNKIELLSPGGDFEKLKYAIMGGADAVYISGKNFGARKFATNFSLVEIEEGIKFAHLRNKKVYITVNTIIYSHEIKEAYDYCVMLDKLGVDGIILQDLGLANILLYSGLRCELHSSTQMSAHSSYDATILKSIGFHRIVLARENTIEEIKKINEVGIDLETFIHGAHCISYSGQCLMSSMIGFRSGNRGTCAQPCRKKYSFFNNEGKKIEFYGEYLLSPKDMESFNSLDVIKEAGVKSLKIEGRMKSNQYAYLSTKIYRNELDDKIDDSLKDMLLVLFNRGLTKGRKFNVTNSDFMNYESPQNKGIIIGKVIESRNKILKIRTQHTLNVGDELKMFLKEESIGGRVEKIIEQSSNEYILKFSRDLVRGKDVYLTYKTEIIDKIDEMFRNTRISFPIDGKFIFRVGKNPKCIIKYNDLYVEHEIDQLIQEASSKPFNEDSVRVSINKTNETVYYFDTLSIEFDQNSFMPVSLINQLRREALEKLDILRLKLTDFKYNECIPLKDRTKMEEIKTRIVQIGTKDAYNAVKGFPFDFIYFDNMDIINDINDKRIIPVLPNITKDNQIELLIKNLERFDTVVVSNIGQVKAFENKNMISDYSLNVVNEHSIDLLKKVGIKRVTLSVELSKEEITNLMKKSSLYTEVITYGKIKNMITDHCMFKKDTPCEKCHIEGASLMDEFNQKYPLRRFESCRVAIYHSKPIDLITEESEMERMNIKNFRYVFIDENKEQIKDICEKIFSSNPVKTKVFLGHYARKNDIMID
jgi:putative protease